MNCKQFHTKYSNYGKNCLKGDTIDIDSRALMDARPGFLTKIKSKTIFGNGIGSPFGTSNRFFDPSRF